MKIYSCGFDRMTDESGSEIWAVQVNGSENKECDGEGQYISTRWEKTCATLEEAFSYVHDLKKRLAEA